MNTHQLLLKMLPGLIPLFIFIVIDELWGTKAGLIAALVVGTVEILYFLIKERRIDKFVLFDTLLLLAMGGVSLALENDVFFKLKPGIIGLIICVLLGVSVFTPQNMLLQMSKRYMGDLTLSDEQYQQMNRSIKILFYIFVFHTALVFYAAWFLSDKAWFFISGGLFYIIIGGYFLYEFLKLKLKKQQMAHEEWFPLVDESGKVIGKASRSACHSNPDLLHPVVHLHVFDSRGNLYLQKRPANKTIQPDKWDTSVGGHLKLGETVEQGLMREASEELGLVDFEPRFLFSYVWKSAVESELVFTFATRYTKAITINKDELADGRFWNFEALKKKTGTSLFTPNFEYEFALLAKNKGRAGGLYS
ncbi:MAG: NUDIX hydrolase [Bacteroidetes bacterium HGW-Bacteroidetes-4]|nr:MAG: NUDIX hydrolase [Bacteroidetes bacterium HGW-Bacteroidetes-4]